MYEVFAFEHECSFKIYLKGFVTLARRTFLFVSRLFYSGQPPAISISAVH